MNYWQKFKNWIIKHLGGWTDGEYGVMRDDLKTAIKMRDVAADDLAKTNKALEQLSKSHSALSSLHVRLAEEYKDCRDTLAGLEILKTKIETFRAEGAFPYGGRSGIQLQRRIAEKKTAVVNSLVNDILQQNRFIVIDVDEGANKIKVSATISVLEGGVISGKETQLQENTGGAEGSRESSETPKDD